MKRSVLFSAALVLLVATPPVRAEEPSGVEVVTKMVEAMNRHDYEALAKVVSLNVIRHCTATPQVSVSSLAEFEQFLRANATIFPDERQEIDAIFGSGDMVGLRARYIGTQKGPMGSTPATNKRIELEFLSIVRVEEGKVAELWVSWDNVDMAMQLGQFPAPADPGQQLWSHRAVSDPNLVMIDLEFEAPADASPRGRS